MAITHTNQPAAAYRSAPRRRRRRSWIERQQGSRRGRFELGILGGGSIALMLAAALPGQQDAWSIVMLVCGGCAMALVASITGFVPAIAASLFAPLVVALTDPMWTMGAFADFNLANESSATFAVFVTATIVGCGYRRWLRRERGRRSDRLWRASPR